MNFTFIVAHDGSHAALSAHHDALNNRLPADISPLRFLFHIRITEDVLKRFPNKTASRIRGCTRLNSVSFFELIDTSACIHKFLSACEEGVAFTANINFQHVGILRRTRRESRSASANDLHFVIFRMNVSFHIFHLTRYYTDLRMILYPFFYLSSTDFGIQTKILAY